MIQIDSGILRKTVDMEEYRMNYGDFAKTPQFDGLNRRKSEVEKTCQIIAHHHSNSPGAVVVAIL